MWFHPELREGKVNVKGPEAGRSLEDWKHRKESRAGVTQCGCDSTGTSSPREALTAYSEQGLPCALMAPRASN